MKDCVSIYVCFSNGTPFSFLDELLGAETMLAARMLWSFFNSRNFNFTPFMEDLVNHNACLSIREAIAIIRKTQGLATTDTLVMFLNIDEFNVLVGRGMRGNNLFVLIVTEDGRDLLSGVFEIIRNLLFLQRTDSFPTLVLPLLTGTLYLPILQLGISSSTPLLPITLSPLQTSSVHTIIKALGCKALENWENNISFGFCLVLISGWPRFVEYFLQEVLHAIKDKHSLEEVELPDIMKDVCNLLKTKYETALQLAEAGVISSALKVAIFRDQVTLSDKVPGSDTTWDKLQGILPIINIVYN